MRTDVAILNSLRRRDITGQVFHKLTVITYDSDVKKWVCRCECGGSVKVRTAALNNGNTKSCGCYQKFRASTSATKQHRDKRVSMGLPEDQLLTSDIERVKFMPMSKDILARDDYTCAWCSKVGSDLNVHHIELWSVKADRRFDRANLVTLCKPCHLTVHKNNFHGEPDPIMSVLLEGYAKIKENPV
jgi:5-methylcytosine-specific restriction endonuclease McrA